MRRSLLLCAVATLAACGPATLEKPPPTDRFYYPTGLTVAGDYPGGVLYVASSNFDKRFDQGTVLALEVEKLKLPAFGAELPADGPPQLTTLPLEPEGLVFVQSFAGELGAFSLAEGALRLFLPSRAEGHPLQVLDAQGARLTLERSASLVENQDSETGVPRATSPYGVGISREGEVFITQIEPIDSPAGSKKDWRAYLLKLNAQEPSVTDESYIQLPGLSGGVAVGSRYAFLSGRDFGSRSVFHLVTLVDRTTRAILQPTLEEQIGILDARGIALSSDERRLYVAARFPNTLVVVDVQGADGASPALKLVRTVPLPEGPNQVKLLPRAEGGDLVVVSCSSAGSIVLFDPQVGEVVAQIPSVGSQPFAMAAQRVGEGARLFVSNFGDGRVAVIDIPQLSRPQSARVVAHIGAPQNCITNPGDANCGEVAQ